MNIVVSHDVIRSAFQLTQNHILADDMLYSRILFLKELTDISHSINTVLLYTETVVDILVEASIFFNDVILNAYTINAPNKVNLPLVS